MSEKRTSCRVRRRLPVSFSDGQRQNRGQTANVSRTGLCVHSDSVVTPGTEVMLTLTLPGIAEVKALGVVEWARKLRGTEVLQAGNSMGIRFVTPPGADYDTFMGMIEGMAQAHGLTTRGEPAGARAAEPPAARRAPPSTPFPVEVAPLPREPAPRFEASPPARRIDPRREPEPASPPARRIDPRREPEPEPERPPQRLRRDVAQAPDAVVEIQPHRTEPAPTRTRPEQRLDFAVGPDDLAAPRVYPSSLSTARVAWLFEQGAAELVATRLRPHTTTVGVSLEVDVPPRPLAVGTPLAVTVSLASIGSDLRTFGFEILVNTEDRVVATGTHVRVVVDSAVE